MHDIFVRVNFFRQFDRFFHPVHQTIGFRRTSCCATRGRSNICHHLLLPAMSRWSHREIGPVLQPLCLHSNCFVRKGISPVLNVTDVGLFGRRKRYLEIDQGPRFRCDNQRSTYRQCPHHGKCLRRLHHGLPRVSVSQVYRPGIQFVRWV